MRNIFKVVVLISLAGLGGLVWSGCGKKAPETEREQVTEKTNGNEKLDVSDGNASPFNPIRKGPITGVTGKNAELLEDFPKDIPVYPGAEILMAMKMNEDKMFTVQFDTADAVDAVGAYYKKELAGQGWSEMQSIAQGGETPMQMMMYCKENRGVTVTLASKEGKTRINLQTGSN